MSFSFEFIAKSDDAFKIIEQEHAPNSVKAFLQTALSAFPDPKLVYVKAMGHQYEGGGSSYPQSTATLDVHEVVLREPKPPVVETKTYTDGTTATGVAPLPEQSPTQQDAAIKDKTVSPFSASDEEVGQGRL